MAQPADPQKSPAWERRLPWIAASGTAVLKSFDWKSGSVVTIEDYVRRIKTAGWYQFRL